MVGFMDVAYPGFGTIVIDGERFDHDVVVDRGRIRPRDKAPSRRHQSRYGHTPLSVGEDLPWSGERLVIGTGASGRLPIMAELYEEARVRGVEVIALPTADVCELLAAVPDEDVNAVLHLTC